MRSIPAILLGVALVAGSPLPRGARSAWADEDDAALARARKHFKRGEKLYALGKFDAALAAYEAAFDAAPLPEFLFNIGQCHRNLDHYDEAIFSFNKYLRLEPDADNRDAVEKLIAELETDRDRAGHGPTGNGNPIGPIPGPGPGGDNPPRPGRPFYQKWWFWTGVAVVGASATVLVMRSGEAGPPSSSLGNLDFPK